MTRVHHVIRAVCVAFWLGALLTGCGPGRTIIVPEEGYRWPSTERDYWPTDGWIAAPLEAHGIDPAKIELADRFARGAGASKTGNRPRRHAPFRAGGGIGEMTG